jgi:hypothetical protein
VSADIVTIDGSPFAMRPGMSQCLVARAGIAAGLAASLPQQQCAPFQQTWSETREAVFHALDGREVGLRGTRWRIEVFSVLDLGGHRFVQLAVNGPTLYMLTLRMKPGAQARHVVPKLLPWLARPTSSGEILDVATG